MLRKDTLFLHFTNFPSSIQASIQDRTTHRKRDSKILRPRYSHSTRDFYSFIAMRNDPVPHIQRSKSFLSRSLKLIEASSDPLLTIPFIYSVYLAMLPTDLDFIHTSSLLLTNSDIFIILPIQRSYLTAIPKLIS